MAKPASDKSQNLPWLGRKLLGYETARNNTRYYYLLLAICAVLLVADFLYKRKTYLEIETIPGFYALFGFVACAAMMLVARLLVQLFRRDDTFYSPDDVEAEAYPEAGLERLSNDGNKADV